MSSSRDAVIAARYLHEGETSENQLWHRVATAWATDDSEIKEFEEMILDGRAIPNTPALANAGRDSQMGSACFVLHVPDDTEGILQTLADATMIHKFGGGTGFDFTPVRGRGTTVNSTGRGAPGPVEGPLKGFSEWIARWSQAGIRSGANMGMLHIDHPDIFDFITAKTVEGTITNFNLSVQLTDEFMVSAAAGVPLGTRDAEHDSYLWDLLTRHAWLNGEPGAFFIDRTNNTRLHPETIHATNPCGEVPLLPYEACVLGSVNLAAHVTLRNGVHVMHEPNLRASVKQLTRMLDNIVEAQDYPLEIIRKTHQKYRKIGVGPMGLADALYLLGIPYDHPEAVALSEDWARIIQEASYEASVELAHSRGAYREHHRLYGGQEHPHEGDLPFRRNLCAQVVAPTGSIARVIPKHYDKGCPVSFGIEPHFDTDTDGSFTSFVVGKQLKEHTTFAGHPVFRTTTRVPAAQHVKIQAAWQKHVDQAVSKTVNLSHDATQQDVANTFKLAWELGCKGTTVLRNHSRVATVIDCPNGQCAL